MRYKIADLNLDYDAKYEVLKERSKKYEVENNEKSMFQIAVSDEEIEHWEKNNPSFGKEMSEYLLLGVKFYKKLLEYQGCMLHASCVVIDNEAYLFSADCGTGKSTHTSLWLKYLADKNPYILNDDKPALRIIDDEIFAYGTPFSGKNDINENKKVKVKGICFIEQSKINFIREMEPKEVVNLFLNQTVRTFSKEQAELMFDILEIILEKVPFYKLHCDMSREAVMTSYEKMRKGVQK